MTDEQTSHELLAALKALAIELDRNPTRDEFEVRVKNGRRLVDKYFRGYRLFIQAAGLTPGIVKKEKITNEIFRVDLREHLEKYEPKAGPSSHPWPTAAFINDIHWPFQCDAVIEAFFRYVEETQPEWVIINGDAWDMYSHSRFPRSHNIFTPKQEEELSRKANEDFWKKIQKISPKSKCVQLLGNHDARPLKRILESVPTMEHWIEDYFKFLFTFDGVTTVFDTRQEFYLNEYVLASHIPNNDYTKAEYSSFGGHDHKAAVIFMRVRGKTIAKVHGGFAGDPMKPGLTYTPTKINQWTWGFSSSDEWGPRFIPV